MPAIAQDAFGGATSAGSSFDDFQRLVDELSRTLGPCSGLTSEGVDVQHLRQLMEGYRSFWYGPQERGRRSTIMQTPTAS
jgi:hypothetical protein